MDAPPLPMLLPKGIVFNDDRIYKEIASYDVIPPEKIYDYWHVYTTTHLKLKDPTANRLENFWWHVLGSDRGQLSGATLAKIFREISEGPTAVPIRGPPNRYEGPSIPFILKHTVSDKGKAKEPDCSSPAKDESLMTETPRALASSSTKPPPSHPILKKPRGPSSSGPRPTARFVSPAGSDAEDDKVESEADSSTSATGNVSSQQAKNAPTSAPKDKSKKTVGGMSKKKIVASASSKRRPTMPRRQSSQSSATGSEVGSREERSSPSIRQQGQQRPVSPIVERPDSKDDGPRPSAKAAGKRVAIAPAAEGKAAKSNVSTAATKERPEAANLNAKNTKPVKPKLETKGKEAVNEASRTSQDNGVQANSNVRKPAQSGASASPLMRSKHSGDAPRTPSRDIRPLKAGPFQGLISSSVATTSNVAARGTIIEFDENDTAARFASSLQDDFAETRPRRSESTTTLTPTAPSNTPSVPLGRSKSQLSLLLERQGEKKPRR
ncbi:hypothetical protein BJ166DRAFT_587506 [Pestalotiopsis sp. NC0098]|nr:hypothetical protein BJ166DRAFT_587506 [Pestalotiopsis sp. NC0098]